MNARGLFASMIGLAAGCTAAGGLESDESGAGFRVDQIEHTANGTPYFLAGQLGQVAAPLAAGDVARAPEALAGVLPALADALRVPASDLVTSRVERDHLGMTIVRMEQQKNGLRVVGGAAVVEIGTTGVVRSVSSSLRDRALDATPSVAEADAIAAAIAGTEGGARSTHSELTYEISTADGELYLTWEVRVAGAEGVLLDDLVYVDAHSGRVIDRRPQVFPARNRSILDGQGRTYPVLFPPAPQIGSEGTPPTDQIGLAAYDNTGTTYDCYQTLFQRDSYDGAGAQLTSVVHVVFSTGQGGGTSGNNAAWVDQLSQMAYGDGDGTFMTPLARALDVTAHELTHAVTSRTAKLAYQNESGALNEAMSDIVGAVCEAWKDGAISADTWKVGEDIFTPATAGDALRYMNNPTLDAALYPPTLGGSRDFYAERYTGTQDNGGVHLNSGIPNLAFQLLVDGGKHPRDKTTNVVAGIGMEKASKIFYRSLTMGFTANTTMAQARTVTENAAQTLYPGCTRDAVSAAWAAVGVGAPPAPDAVPPTTQIASPADGARVEPGFPVQVTAADDKCVIKVELRVDGTLVQTLTDAPFNFTMGTNLSPGTHTLEVTTYDTTNTAKATATVTIPTPTGGTCTADTECSDGEVCKDGTCQAATIEQEPPGCGCASTGSRGAAGVLAPLFALAFALRRRRTGR